MSRDLVNLRRLSEMMGVEIEIVEEGHELRDRELEKSHWKRRFWNKPSREALKELRTVFRPAAILDCNGRVVALRVIGVDSEEVSLFCTRFTETSELVLYYLNIDKLSFLIEFKRIRNLCIIFSDLIDVSGLSKLKSLKILNLGTNRVQDLKPLSELKELKTLELMHNRIQDLKPLSELKELKTLGLGANQIQDLKPLSELKALKTLELWENQIQDLMPLSELGNLRSLNLSQNQVECVKALAKMARLKSLDVSHNKISKADQGIFRFKKFVFVEYFYNNEGINLYGNPLESPPIEIIERGGPALKRYFAELELEQLRVKELKLILLGDAAAGKTSLLKRLTGEGFRPNEPMTEGIALKNFRIGEGEGQVLVHAWDFGGQEMMHSTHKFFLSRQALYLLVLDNRREDQAEYWLEHVRNYGGDSKVLVLINKCDEPNRQELNRRGLREKYDCIEDFYSISCKRNDGLDQLRKKLEELVAQTNLANRTWPASYFRVKEEIVEGRKPHVTLEDFFEICGRQGVSGSRAAREDLASYLNDLGVVVYFPDFELKHKLVLDPSWVTNGVYALVTAPSVAEAHGLLKKSQIAELLGRRRLDGYKYPSDCHVYLLELMKKFELAYELDDSESLILPGLLGVEEPAFEFVREGALRLELRYSFLPAWVMTRLMVKRHREIEGRLRWRTGCVLKWSAGESRALIRLDLKDKRIEIMLRGEQRRAHLAEILGHLEEIHSNFTNNQISSWLGCPCSRCASSAKPFFHELRRVLFSGLRNKEIGLCEISEEDILLRQMVEELGMDAFLEIKELRELLLAKLNDQLNEIRKEPGFMEQMDELVKLKVPFGFGEVDLNAFIKKLWKWRG